MLKMKLCWCLALCILEISSVSSTNLIKDFLDNKPGILGVLTKPKVPKIPIIPVTGIQIGTQVGGGSFGFGFGFGVSSQTGGVNLPPKEPHPENPETTWEEKDDEVGPRPNWEGDKDEEPTSDHHSNEEDAKSENFDEDKDDSQPTWEEIGEANHDEKSEDLMDTDLVGDGFIDPRKPRVKRRINSKVYHVPIKFISNARPFKVLFHSHPNSLMEEKYI